MKEVKKFRTYRHECRVERERHAKERKREVRTSRLETIYSETAVPQVNFVNF